MIEDIHVLVEYCENHCAILNAKCLCLSAKLRKIVVSDTLQIDAGSGVDQKIFSVDKLEETADIVVLAEKTINKAKENITMKSKVTSKSAVLKSKNKTVTTEKPKKLSSSVHATLNRKKIADKSLGKNSKYSLKTDLPEPSEKDKVLKELEGLVKRSDPDDQQNAIKTSVPKRADPCTTPNILLPNVEKYGSSRNEQFSSLFEDCWMLKKHALLDKDLNLRSRASFLSKLKSSSKQDSAYPADLISDVLKLAEVVAWLKKCVFVATPTGSLSLRQMHFLPIGDALVVLCVLRKLLNLQNQLSSYSTFGVLSKSVTRSESIQTMPVRCSSFLFPSWLPSTLPMNPIDEYSLCKHLELAQNLAPGSTLPNSALILILNRVMISLWCRTFACDETQQWTATAIRGLHNILCSSRLAPPFVLLESDAK